MAVGTGAIQTDAGTVTIYADGIASGYSSVGKGQATKDTLSEYGASGTIQSHIDTEFSVSEKAAEQGLEFVQVLHGIHTEFQFTDATIAQSIGQAKGPSGSSSNQSQKNASLFSEGTR